MTKNFKHEIKRRIKNKLIERKNFFRSPFSIAIGVILLVYAISLLIPVVWGFITSVKSNFDFLYNRLGMPEEWHFDNYSVAFEYFYVIIPKGSGQAIFYLWDMLGVSLFYCCGKALLGAFVPMLAGYLSVAFPNVVSRTITNIVMITMVLPIYGGGGTTLVIYQQLGLYNNLVPYVIFSSFGFGGMNYLIWRANFKATSITFAEAARIDGAGEIAIMFKIQFPLVMKMFMTFALLGFIGTWQDYGTSLIVLPSYPTVAYGLFLYSGNGETAVSSVPMILSGAMIMLLPLLGLFICFHKQLIGNISFGGLKE